jgi:hypothetical protein
VYLAGSQNKYEDEDTKELNHVEGSSRIFRNVVTSYQLTGRHIIEDR